MTKKPIKVLIAKPGLDGHDRGVKVLSYGLRDQGMEVIYTGLRQTPEQIITTALQEDVDVIGLSSLSGAHRELFSRVAEVLKEKNLSGVLLIGGGMIPREDIDFLKSSGVAEVFGPGSSIEEIADYIRRNVKKAS